MPRPSARKAGDSPHVNTAAKETAGDNLKSFERRNVENQMTVHRCLILKEVEERRMELGLRQCRNCGVRAMRYSFAERLWVSLLSALGLSFLICTMGVLSPADL